jgi:glycosyltransferase involved in cell wall biosynthesis
VTARDRLSVLWLVKGLGPGGAERLLTTAASVHDHSSFRFEVAYLLPWKDHLVGELAARGVPSTCLEVHRELDLRWARRLRRLLVERRVDVLHSHSPYPAGVARLVARSLPRRTRPKLVYTLHNRWQSFAWPTRVLNGLTLPLDDADLAVSSDVRATVRPRLRSHIEVVVHGIALEEARGAAARAETRAELGLGDEDVAIGTVANFRAQKNYPNLFEAAEILRGRGVPFRLVAVGQGPLEEEMRALHSRMGLDDVVSLLGYRDDAVRVMSACDVFTLASDHEGIPVAVMEALALGLPVVATRVGGVSEAITDDVEGVLVPPRSPEMLADAWQRVVTDAALRARLAAAAARRAPAFDVRTAVRRIEDVYRQVTGR